MFWNLTNLIFSVLLLWVLFSKPFINLSDVHFEVCEFNKRVAIKWMPCPNPTGITLMARVAGSNSGVHLDVLESMLELVL
jgi:hypothetical protein